MGGGRAFRVLHSLMQDLHPEIFCLMETISDHVCLERLRMKLGFNSKLVVDREGNSGSLCLFWKNGIDVSLLCYSRFHIDVVVVSHSNKKWRMIGFYEHPISSQRGHCWNLLKILAGMSSLPWLVEEDFNEIISLTEKSGGNIRQEVSMNDFQDTLDDCDLRDLEFSGPFFTWSNRCDTPQTVQERLDHNVSNVGWQQLFPHFSVKHIIFWKSDHQPILLEILDRDMRIRELISFTMSCVKWVKMGV